MQNGTERAGSHADSPLPRSAFMSRPGGLAPPLFVQIEISSRCNLKCRMCPLTLGTTLSSSDQELMSESTLNEVLALGRLAGEITVAGFGEPLTHPRFMDYLREIDKAGVMISFSTNGIGFEKFAPELGQLKRLKHVNISIDSPDPEIYRDIRGGDLARAISGARSIAQSLHERVPITVGVVVMKSNIRSLLSFPALLADMGIRFLLLQSLHAYTDGFDGEHLHTGRYLQTFRPALRLHTVMDKLIAECRKHGVSLLRGDRVALDSYEPWNSSRQYFTKAHSHNSTRACTIPFESIYVDSGGRVLPCCHAASGPVLGHTATESLADIWSGPRMQSFRDALLNPATTPEICRLCSVVPWGEHPYRLYQAEITACDYADKKGVCLRVRNKGTFTWTRQHPLRLAPARPRDRNSARYRPSWDSWNRVATMRDDRVEPGSETILEFELGDAGDGEEFFALLIEGKQWLYSMEHSYLPEQSIA